MAHEEEVERVHMLYRLLVEAIITGVNTIGDELSKPKSDQDTFYLMGQSELNVALTVAADALESSGLIDENELQCRSCGGLITDHAATTPEGASEKDDEPSSPPKPN